jgi:hypothetical protein
MVEVQVTEMRRGYRDQGHDMREWVQFPPT